jgi:acyl-coenzyme A thioesterase PaaI-like protein
MAWAPSSFDSWAVTAEMTVRYRSPAMPGEELQAEGRVVQRRRRIYDVRGEVRGGDGRVIAEGSGRYLGATPTEKAELRERYGLAPGTAGE